MYICINTERIDLPVECCVCVLWDLLNIYCGTWLKIVHVLLSLGFFYSVYLLERFNLRHHFALPQWQNLGIVRYLFLYNFHIQVLALRFKEVSTIEKKIIKLMKLVQILLTKLR